MVGPSGSGKSTMMNLLGLLDTPTSGQYRLAGVDTQTLSSQEKSRLRNQDIGFVFQQFHLLPALTALQNAQLPLLYRGLSQRASLDAARAALVAVGLEHRLSHRPAELSGGERQRVVSPAPWPASRGCCWPTSRPARWIRQPARACSRCCAKSPPRTERRC